MARCVIFRFDANEHIGGGHLIRCRILADELVKHGWRVCAAVARDLTDIDQLLGSGAMAFPGEIIALENADSPIPTAAKAGVCDLVIIDTYLPYGPLHISPGDRQPQVMRFIDWVQPARDSDIILDISSGQVSDTYRELAKPNAMILTDRCYVLVGDAFSQRRQSTVARLAATNKRCDLRVFMSFGLGDTADLCVSALQGLAPYDMRLQRIDCAVSQGTAHTLQAFLDDETGERERLAPIVHLHPDCTDVAKIMATADLAIGGCGMTSWERCCLGLPTLGWALSHDQQANAIFLREQAAMMSPDTMLLKTDPARAIGEVFRSMADQPEMRQNMSANAAAIIDGQGASRVAKAIIAAIGEF